MEDVSCVELQKLGIICTGGTVLSPSVSLVYSESKGLLMLVVGWPNARPPRAEALH